MNEVSAGEQLGRGDTGQDHPVRRAAGRMGEQQHKGEGDHRADEGAARQADHSRPDSEDHDQYGTGRGAGRDTEDKRIGQRIAKQRLHDRTAQPETGTAERGEQGTRQTEVPDDAVTDRGDVRRGTAEMADDDRSHLTDRQTGRPQRDCHGSRSGQRDNTDHPQQGDGRRVVTQPNSCRHLTP